MMADLISGCSLTTHTADDSQPASSLLLRDTNALVGMIGAAPAAFRAAPARQANILHESSIIVLSLYVIITDVEQDESRL